MNILIVNLILSTAEKGVITRRTTNSHTMIHTMARGFRRLGHTVTLVASEEYRPTEPERQDFDIKYFRSRVPRVFKPDLLPWPAGFGRWLRRHHKEYDLVITSDTFSMATFTIAQICPEKAVVWHELSKFQRAMCQIPARVWYGLVTRLGMRRLPVVARSEAARRFISRFMPRTRQELVDHGTDADIFFPGDVRGNNFMIISQLIPRKRIDRMIRHFAEFVAMPGRGGYTLDIVGDGPLRAELEALVDELGVGCNVTFRGYMYHPEWSNIARGAIGLLIDTESDLNMVTVAESIANGTPVLTNTVPTNSCFVDSSGVGIVRDGWGAEELCLMADRYETHHEACCRVRHLLTNEDCARRLIELQKGD